MKSILHNKWFVVAGSFLLTASFILWEYFNGGVITHHLLADENLPGISNWWGLLTVPLLSFILMSLVVKRRKKHLLQNADIHQFNTNLVRHFLAALAFGILVSILFEFNYENILQYLILLPVVIAIFKPVHFPECLLGFVLGMMFTFGGILPIIIGTVLFILCFVVNRLVYVLRRVVTNK